MATSPRPLIQCCCVSYGEVILVSHQKEVEHYASIIHCILPTLPNEGNTKLTYPAESFQVHILVHDSGLVFSCLTNRTNKHYLPFIFLEKVKDTFCDIPSLITRSYSAVENEFDRDFSPVLASLMHDFNIGEGDKISQLQSHVDDVKQIILENVKRLIDRGERLDDLLLKTEDLEASGGIFTQRARELKVKAQCKNLKMWLVIGGFLTVILTVAILIATGVIPV